MEMVLAHVRFHVGTIPDWFCCVIPGQLVLSWVNPGKKSAGALPPCKTVRVLEPEVSSPIAVAAMKRGKNETDKE